jgi:hypothetical protein
MTWYDYYPDLSPAKLARYIDREVSTLKIEYCNFTFLDTVHYVMKS